MKKKILIPATTFLLIFLTGFLNISIAKSIKITPLSVKVKTEKTIKFKVSIKSSIKRNRSGRLPIIHRYTTANS